MPLTCNDILEASSRFLTTSHRSTLLLWVISTTFPPGSLLCISCTKFSTRFSMVMCRRRFRKSSRDGWMSLNRAARVVVWDFMDSFRGRTIFVVQLQDINNTGHKYTGHKHVLSDIKYQINFGHRVHVVQIFTFNFNPNFLARIIGTNYSIFLHHRKSANCTNHIYQAKKCYDFFCPKTCCLLPPAINAGCVYHLQLCIVKAKSS